MASSRDRGRAEGSLLPAALLGLGVCGLLWVCGLGGCGSAAPTEATIYHDPALRPGAIDPTSDVERELLIRLSTLPGDQPVQVAGETVVVEPAYAAASGRRCRAITWNGARRLACEADDGWIFVPNVRQDPEEASQ